jgi:hypothetical protein
LGPGGLLGIDGVFGEDGTGCESGWHATSTIATAAVRTAFLKRLLIM